MHKQILSLAALAGALLLASCSSGIDTPSGSIGNYTSARMIAIKPSAQTTAEERSIHNMIQNSIKAQFTSRGKSFGQPGAELVVAYLVVYQDNAMTTYYDAYFGSGNDAEAISDEAHLRGVTNGERRESFERAGLIVDVLDARTNKLIFRNYSTGDIVRGVSSQTRAARVNDAVTRALSAFFK